MITAQLASYSANAAGPAVGSVAPAGPPFTWTGTATASGATNEASCAEGTTCDTFRLTVAAGTYTAKLVEIRISWVTASNNYDVYIHKAPNAGSTNSEANATPPIAQATAAAPGTRERVFVDPTVHGVGDYTVRVVYLAAAGSDQYKASAAVVDAPNVTATMTDSFTDRGDGKAHEGDNINYGVTITNTGTGDAAGVKFNNPAPSNTTDVAGSLRMSALAINDAYDVNFNTALNVPAPGVLANDKGIPSPSAVPIAGGATSGGGTVTLNADGSFSYAAASGFGGTDTFSYTATNVQPPNDSATVTITVNNPPTDIALSSSSLDENQPAGTDVGTLSTTDPDASHTHTYSLVAGTGDTDNASFQIDGSILETSGPLDFETKSSYSVRIQTDDGHGGTFAEQFTITANDLNDAPDDITLSNASVDENRASGTTVGTLSASDDDAGDTHTFAFASGTGSDDNGSFQISGSTLQTAATFDFETKSSYSIRVEANDGNGGTFEKQLTISVNGVNEPATDITVTPSSVDENQPSGTTVGTLESVDPDAQNTHTYTFVSGAGDTDNASFTIDGQTLKTAATFNFEVKSSYSVRVQTDDGQSGGTFAKQLVITIANGPDAPTGIALSNAAVDENAAAGTTVGTFSTTDEDVGDVQTYGLADGGADNGSFTIDGNTLKTAASFNFETKSSYAIRIISIDGAARSIEKDFTISVTNMNDAPTAIALTASTVPENQPSGTTVGTLSSTDEDAGDTHSYAFVTGEGDDDNALFTISGTTLQTAAAFDFETKSSYTIRVSTTDSGTPAAIFSQALAITISDVNDAPVVDLDENEGGTSSTVTFAEALIPGTGVAVAPNATVTDQDDANIASATITLTNHPDDADESLSVDTTDTGIAASTYNATTGVLTLTNVAPKADYQKVIRTLKYNNTAAPPDATDRLINVTVNDGAVDSPVAVATVKVVPLNTPPVLDLNGAATLGSDSSAAFVEDGGPVTLAPDAEITEVDDTHLESATITLTNRPDGNLEVITVDTTATPSISASLYDSNTGVITLTGHDTIANYEAVLRSAKYNNADVSPDTTSRSVKFKVNDGQDDSPEQTSTVSVAGNNEPPTFTPGGDVTVKEDSSAYSATWATNISPGPSDESSQTVTFVVSNDDSGLFTSGGQPAINASGVLSFTPAANAFGSATVSVQLTDNGGTANGGSDESATVTFTLTLTAVNDPPTFTPGGNVAVDEDSGAYSAAWATSVSAGSNESGQTVSFGVTNDNSGLFTAGGQPAIAPDGTLTFTPAPNAFGSATVTVAASDNGGTASGGDDTADTINFTLTVNPVNDPPVAGSDGWDFIGNTVLEVDAAHDFSPGPSVHVSSHVLVNDSDPVENDSISVSGVAGSGDNSAPYEGATVNGGTVTIETDGRFVYVPKAGDSSGTDSFQYVLTDSPSVGSPASANGTVTLTRKGRVWYVNNQAAAPGSGTSATPFSTLSAADTASVAGDTIYVFFGNGTTAGQNSGITLDSNQRLLGAGVALSMPLSVNGTNPYPLLGAGSQPLITNSGGNGVTITNVTGVEVRGLSIAASSSRRGIVLNATDSSNANATIANNAITGSGISGIEVNANSTGTTTVDVQNNTLAALAYGFNAATGAAGTLNIVFSNNNINSGALSGVAINGGGFGGTANITAFSGNQVSGNVGGNGISITSAVFDATPGGAYNVVSGGDTKIGDSGNPVGSHGMQLSNCRGDLSFADLDIFSSNSTSFAFSASSPAGFDNAAGEGLRVTVSAGAGTLTAPSGGALRAIQVLLNLQNVVVTSSGTSFYGVSLDNTDGSTVSMSAGSSISTSFGNATAFHVKDSDGGTYTYNGTINTTAGKGVELTNNTGATIAFTNTLTLSTATQPAFAATGGGTVNVTGSSNTLTTTTGTALNVTNTDIGSSGLTFRSISSNGAANGIVLSNTGANNALTVTSTGGGTCTDLDSSGCTGGAIGNTTGADTTSTTPTGTAIVLNNTRGVSLTRMRLFNNSNYGIKGTNLVGLTIANSVINGTNGTSALTDHKDGCARFVELTGTVSVTNTEMNGGYFTNFMVDNTAGVLNATLSNFKSGTLNATGGDDAVQFEGLSTSTMNVTVQNSVITTASGDIFQYIGDGTGGGALVFTGNTITNNEPSVSTGGGGIAITGGTRGAVTLNLSNNSFRDSLTNAITIIKSRNNGESGSFIGTINNNTIGVAADTNSGSREGDGMEITHGGSGTMTLSITNNKIYQYNSSGMQFVAGLGNQDTGNMNLSISGNTIANFGNTSTITLLQGMRFDAGVTAGDTFQMCVNFGPNSITGSSDQPNKDFRLVASQSTTIRLPGYVGGSTDGAAVATFVAGKIGGGAQGTAVANPPGTFVGGAAPCATP